MTVDDVIRQFGLKELAQEGGWFRRIYTGDTATSSEPDRSSRPDCTTIYALFSPEAFSALHRLDAIEQFFFIDGDPFEVFCIGADGNGRDLALGRNLEAGESPHLVFEKGSWFGGKPRPGGPFGWSLLTCVVTPGFHWEGFELADRAKLSKQYPSFADRIAALTR